MLGGIEAVVMYELQRWGEFHLDRTAEAPPQEFRGPIERVDHGLGFHPPQGFDKTERA